MDIACLGLQLREDSNCETLEKSIALLVCFAFSFCRLL